MNDPIKFDHESSDVNLARLEARASALPFAVGLCPDPSHAAEFYMPLTEEDVANEHMRECPLDCPHELVVYRR